MTEEKKEEPTKIDYSGLIDDIVQDLAYEIHVKETELKRMFGVEDLFTRLQAKGCFPKVAVYREIKKEV